VPLYVLGFMGMTRRLNHYDNPAWHPWLLVAAFGAVLIAIGIAASCCSSSSYPQPQPAGLSRHDGRPVGGRTLEWATSSPPADYNFAVLPQVRTLDAYADMKARATPGRTRQRSATSTCRRTPARAW
jgi:cytochrome o ubiquinol oxidase subunit 1